MPTFTGETGQRLCLGHASIGAYSCFGQPEEGIDDDGDGYCSAHAAFIREETRTMGDSICTKCAHMVWNAERTEGHWEPMPNCARCGGSGKETRLSEPEPWFHGNNPDCMGHLDDV